MSLGTTLIWNGHEWTHGDRVPSLSYYLMDIVHQQGLIPQRVEVGRKVFVVNERSKCQIENTNNFNASLVTRFSFLIRCMTAIAKVEKNRMMAILRIRYVILIPSSATVDETGVNIWCSAEILHKLDPWRRGEWLFRYNRCSI